MIMSRHPKRPLTILYLLGGYIVLQFAWWAFLLLEGNPGRKGMVIGEGVVFLLLLLFGLYRLKRSYDREMELAEQERNFMMAITHELRSPITSIKLFLQTIQRMNPEDQEQTELADSALSETERLNGLIDNVLLASRIDSEHFALDLAPRELGELVQQELDVPSRTIGKEHRTRFDIPRKVHAEVDLQAFRSMLGNLYENAIKYAPEGTEVLIAVQEKEGEVRIRVQDEGEGIAEAEKEKVRKKFYRSGDEDTRNSKGSGLGLYLVDRLARLHGGSLELMDREDGNGTVAELRLPSA